MQHQGYENRYYLHHARMMKYKIIKRKNTLSIIQLFPHKYAKMASKQFKAFDICFCKHKYKHVCYLTIITLC